MIVPCRAGSIRDALVMVYAVLAIIAILRTPETKGARLDA
jgi:hypothetical protein